MRVYLVPTLVVATMVAIASFEQIAIVTDYSS